MEFKNIVQPTNYLLSWDMLFITSIRLNGGNYAQWARSVEVFLLGRKKFDYLINEPLASINSKYANWRAKDAQIRSCLWNSIEFKISCSLVFLPTTKLFGNRLRNFNLVLTI